MDDSKKEKINPLQCDGRDFFPWDIFVDFKKSYFERYIKFIRSNVDSETRELDKQWEEAKSRKYANSDHREWESDHLIDEAFHASEVEQLMLRSFIVSVFIFIEESLNDFSRHLQRSHDQIFSASDMKGMGIDRPITYMEVIFQKKFPFDEKLREEFKIARKIRNAIVHNDAKLKKEDSSSIAHYFKSSSAIKITQARKAVLSFEYADSLIRLSDRISKELSEICQVETR